MINRICRLSIFSIYMTIKGVAVCNVTVLNKNWNCLFLFTITCNKDVKVLGALYTYYVKNLYKTSVHVEDNTRLLKMKWTIIG